MMTAIPLDCRPGSSTSRQSLVGTGLQDWQGVVINPDGIKHKQLRAM
jgi:hypothetical protein